MRELAGYLILTIYLSGTLAALAHDTLGFARLYQQSDEFRARADRFSRARTGPLASIRRPFAMAVMGLGLILNALTWPGVLLYDLARQLFTRTHPTPPPENDHENQQHP